MRSFARVADTGGISAAADNPGVAKSAVSRHLGEFEPRLGVQLRERYTCF